MATAIGGAAHQGFRIFIYRGAYVDTAGGSCNGIFIATKLCPRQPKGLERDARNPHLRVVTIVFAIVGDLHD